MQLYFYILNNYFRLKNADCIIKEISSQVRMNPTPVSHIPHALNYLVSADTIEHDAPEVCFTVFISCL